MCHKSSHQEPRLQAPVLTTYSDKGPLGEAANEAAQGRIVTCFLSNIHLNLSPRHKTTLANSSL